MTAILIFIIAAPGATLALYVVTRMLESATRTGANAAVKAFATITILVAVTTIILLVLGAAQNTVLGGILSFSSRLLYTAYAGVSDTTIFDMDRVTDQRVGGAIMWVVGDFVFLAAASVAFFLWLAEEEEMQKRRERIASR